ncbi:6-bladed beta-propeller [Candidatus Halobeggiatoa sp. HSG11]|nr:6-bladed beta-propeller [Candidatus Halobeggiatoa sp. HSG11]
MKLSNLFYIGLSIIFAHVSYAEAPHLKQGMKVQFEHVMTIGSKGSGPGQFSYVEDFAWDIDGNLLVTDAVNSNVQVFNRLTGKFIVQFSDVDDELFEKPEGIAVDPEGNILVSDYAIGYIKKFDKQYRYLSSFSDFGTEPGENMEAEFMDIAYGLLYMADAGNNRINVFDLKGNFKFDFGSKGSGPAQMKRPEAAKVDSQGNIWVSDLGNNRIQLYSKDGKFLQQWGEKGSAEGQFRKPTGIALDQYDNIYVGEVHNDRVQVFDKHFNFITMWGKFGNKIGEFGNIHGIIVDERGYVYVDDTANNRIQVFKPVIK